VSNNGVLNKKTYDSVKLGEVLISAKGKKPKFVASEPSDGWLPYINIKAFEQHVFDEYTDGENCLPCEDGDLLMVWDGSRSGMVGKAYKGYVGSTLAKISVPGVTNEFLYYFLQGKYRILNSKVKGTGTPHVNPEILGNFDFPIIPMEEQLRIIAKIEELFSELDKGVEALQKMKMQLKLYRQAVLKDAFDRYKSFSNITNYFDVSGGLTLNSRRNVLPIKMPYLRVANVYYNFIDLTDIKEIGVKENEIDRTLLKEQDLLIVEGNGSKEQIGRVSIWNGQIKQCLHQNHIIKARPNGSMLSKFALYYLMSKDGRNQILEVASSTSGLYTLSIGKVKNLQVPTCSLEEQREIISIIENRISVCEHIEKSIDVAEIQAESLRQSILQMAFEGKLVTHEEEINV
jgi:type I restriction enzyme S subunit